MKHLGSTSSQDDIASQKQLGGGGGSSALSALLTSDVGVTETTLTNALSVIVEANTVYALRAFVPYRTTDTAKGIKAAIGGTAGVQTLTINGRAMTSAGSMLSLHTKVKGEGLTFPTSKYGGDDNLLVIEGIVFVTGVGTITLQVASAVQYDYCAFQKGSILILEKTGTISP